MASTDRAQAYEKAKSDRQRYVDEILKSRAAKKIVVAGPGTGKTYLFKRVLEGKSKNLTLTFINSLVEDLSLELCGLSEVRTLHSFARGLIKNAVIFPKLSSVIRRDYATTTKPSTNSNKQAQSIFANATVTIILIMPPSHFHIAQGALEL